MFRYRSVGVCLIWFRYFTYYHLFFGWQNIAWGWHPQRAPWCLETWGPNIHTKIHDFPAEAGIGWFTLQRISTSSIRDGWKTQPGNLNHPSSPGSPLGVHWEPTADRSRAGDPLLEGVEPMSLSGTCGGIIKSNDPSNLVEPVNYPKSCQYSKFTFKICSPKKMCSPSVSPGIEVVGPQNGAMAKEANNQMGIGDHDQINKQ